MSYNFFAYMARMKLIRRWSLMTLAVVAAAEIAAEQGMTENAVWVRLYRVRDKLRLYLNERGYRI